MGAYPVKEKDDKLSSERISALPEYDTYLGSYSRDNLRKTYHCKRLTSGLAQCGRNANHCAGATGGSWGNLMIETTVFLVKTTFFNTANVTRQRNTMPRTGAKP
jgi:hypothetical protein